MQMAPLSTPICELVNPSKRWLMLIETTPKNGRKVWYVLKEDFDLEDGNNEQIFSFTWKYIGQDSHIKDIKIKGFEYRLLVDLVFKGDLKYLTEIKYLVSFFYINKKEQNLTECLKTLMNTTKD